MKKAKVVLKQTDCTLEKGLTYTSKHTGDEGFAFTMAIGFAISLAKQNGLSLTKVKELVTDIYKETEDIDDGKN